MRMAELSARTGVPVATIKYYMREGLLPHGERTGRTQARYDESHVHRVRLVRGLIEVGGLSIAAAREVLALMHEPGRGKLEQLGKVHFAVQRARHPHGQPPSAEASARVTELLGRRGWRASETNPARAALAGVLDHFTRLGEPAVLGLLETYADAAERVADAELDTLHSDDVEHMAERVVLMTVLGAALLDSLRALAQESAATAKLT